MDKDLALQIGVAVVITIIVFLIGMAVVNSMMDASVDQMQKRFNASFCDNLTKEAFNTTPHSDWCIYNESSEKYELAPFQLLNSALLK
jgi:hypothetical protein